MIGGANKWTAWVKEWAEKNNVTYSCAVSIPECNEQYHAHYGTKPSKKTLERRQAKKAEATGKKQTKAQASLAEMGKVAKAKVTVAKAVAEKIKKRRGRPPKVAEEEEEEYVLTPTKGAKTPIKKRAPRKTKTAKKADNITLEVMEVAEPTQSTKQGFSQKTIDEVRASLLARVAEAKAIPQVATATPTLVPTAPKGKKVAEAKPRKWKKDELKNNFANWLSWTKGKKISNIDKASLPELTELYERYNVTPEQVEAEVMAEKAKRSGEQARLEATRDSPESVEYDGKTLVKIPTKGLNDVGIHLPNDIDMYKSADGTFYERDQLKKTIIKSSASNQQTISRLLNKEKKPTPAPEAKSSGKESRWAEDSDNFGGSNATISKAKDKFGAQWLFGGDDYFYGVKKDGEYYRFKYDEYPEPRKQSEKFYDDAKEWVFEERARRGTEEIIPNSGIYRHLPDEKDVLWDKYLSGKTGRGYDMVGGLMASLRKQGGMMRQRATGLFRKKGGMMRGGVGTDDEGETDSEMDTDTEDEDEDNPLAHPHFWDGNQWVPMPNMAPPANLMEDDEIIGEGLRRMMMRGRGWEEKPAPSGNAFLDTITSVGHELGKAHPASKYVNPFDAGFKFGEKVVAPALMKTKLGNPKTGIFSKKFWTIKKKHH